MMMTGGYGVPDDLISSSQETNPTSFLYNLSLLKDKILQIESVATIIMSPDHHPPLLIPTMATLIQEIIATASSMMFSCQHMSTNSGGDPSAVPSALFSNHHDQHWSCGSQDHNSTEGVCGNAPQKTETNGEESDVIQVNAADLLAKYTHYCHVCGKGFKRDANLRMHMRAHGDEYKCLGALMSKPVKSEGGERRKYSCPQEGCRWNVKHAKFQPLKSMICVKNHYRRSHCPKTYVCKRCTRKHFSVLSDLRTHEKHCGDLKWLCSCGTNFSRKDKLMGHVALFVGHTPAMNAG